MLLPKSASSGTGRLRLLLESAEQSTLNNSRKLFEYMRPTSTVSKPLIAVLLMSVSC